MTGRSGSQIGSPDQTDGATVVTMWSGVTSVATLTVAVAAAEGPWPAPPAEGR